ncbi:MAG: PEP-CTERM-box response regulator transcription factor [Candidatus Omnitrophica bacterium 4484_70.2]|nr:MAG: PEP-CTERM-box response regulator transcription factor [Candidatus Omnitrophica bacterium 4484_70.2]
MSDKEKVLAKILIVDDDVGILNQLKWVLQGEYEVLIASNKEEGLRIIEEKMPELVALDVNLNGISFSDREGIEILDKIKNRFPFIKVIMITGDDSKEIALEAINKGAYDYYVKPINIEELKIIFRRALYIQNLEKENKRLTEELQGRFKFGEMVGDSPQMQNIFSLIRKVAPTDATVLVTGESGTGKELVAKAIHSLSLRRDEAFIVINCASIPENLLESELFGHEKGAFTGAHIQRKGKLEVADKGTVFLDEIGEMSLSLQVKILRFLQEKVIERVGSNTPIELDVRIIAATNQDLKERIKEGKFREDLYYRLSVININLPSLRNRKDDILLLANYFLNKYKKEVSTKTMKGFTKQAKELMLSYSWPGNVREMENRVRRALILADNSFITPSDLGFEEKRDMNIIGETIKVSLKKARCTLEIELIKKALKEAKGNISLAAKILEISRPTLYDLMKKYNISAM